jgi:flagellar motor switch protein FliM
MSEKDLISSEEMSALLPETDGGAAGEREKRSRVTLYNFRRPDRLSKEQIRSLYLLHDLFANAMSSSLPLFLRTFSEVTLISVEQQSYSEYLKGLADPTTIFPISAYHLRGVFAIELSSSVAFPTIDRMLGGEGKTLNDHRAATELELKILEGFLSVIIESYRESWKPIIELRFEIAGRETRPQLLQITAPNEVVVAVSYQVQIGETRGSMSVCLPVAMLEPIIEKFSQSSYSSKKANTPEATHALLKTLSTVRFPVSAELKKLSVPVADLMDLAVGDVMKTGHRLDEPLDIYLGQTVKFKGRLAALESSVVAQITERPPETADEPDAAEAAAGAK